MDLRIGAVYFWNVGPFPDSNAGGVVAGSVHQLMQSDQVILVSAGCLAAGLRLACLANLSLTALCARFVLPTQPGRAADREKHESHLDCPYKNLTCGPRQTRLLLRQSYSVVTSCF
ncbi:hypothetical protein ABBQ38_006698 [Trebouxia sp. C0009 RCD-2024]